MKFQKITLTTANGAILYDLCDVYNNDFDPLAPESPLTFFDPAQGAEPSDMSDLFIEICKTAYNPDDLLFLHFDAFEITTTCTVQELRIMLDQYNEITQEYYDNYSWKTGWRR